MTIIAFRSTLNRIVCPFHSYTDKFVYYLILRDIPHNSQYLVPIIPHLICIPAFSQPVTDNADWGPPFPPLLGKYQEDKQDINSPNPRSPTPTFYLATLLWSIAAVDLIMCHLYKVLYLNCSNSPWKESWLCGVQDWLIFVLVVFVILSGVALVD